MGRSTPTSSSVRALEAIYRDHHRRVRWLLRARGIADSALDDLVHDVFLAVHRRLGDRDETVPIATWIVGVTHNVAFSHRRSRARSERGRARYPEPSAPPGPDEALADREAWKLLRGFVDELPPEQREVFVLVDIVGESVPEVANLSGNGINTLYSRLRLARRRFDARFGVGPVATAVLERGRGSEPVHPRRVARAWALLVLELEAPVTAVASGGAWLTVGKLAVAAGLSAVVFASTRREPPVASSLRTGIASAADVEAVRASSIERPPMPVASLALAIAPVAAPTIPSRRPSVSPPAPTDAVVVEPSTTPMVAPPGSAPDRLALEVAMLRRARAALLAGRPNDALTALAEHPPTSSPDVFARERLVIEHEAVCALGRRARATDTARRLRALGTSIDPVRPCRDR